MDGKFMGWLIGTIASMVIAAGIALVTPVEAFPLVILNAVVLGYTCAYTGMAYGSKYLCTTKNK